MPFGSWEELYASDLQGVWAPLVAPLSFLAWRLVAGAPRAGPGGRAVARFLDRYCLLFAVLGCVDPLATGPLVRALGWSASFGATAVLFAFVWLGDFRVYWLFFSLRDGVRRRGRAAGRAALATCAVPLVAGGLDATLRAAVSGLHGQWLWILYELAFLGVALGLLRWDLPRWEAGPLASLARRVLGYVALYYGLWVASDLLIVLGGLDLAWGLRAVPNQLYYAFFAPFVWLCAFRAGRA
jgi:hypothetical protein